MIPGIFIICNNKKYEGYNIIFLDIKNYILSIIKNDNKKLLKLLSLILKWLYLQHSELILVLLKILSIMDAFSII